MCSDDEREYAMSREKVAKAAKNINDECAQQISTKQVAKPMS